MNAMPMRSLILALVMYATGAATALAAAGEDALAVEGRQLFFGRATRAIAARNGAGADLLTLQELPCAGCHGADGAGSADAGLPVPDIRAAALRRRSPDMEEASRQAALAQVLTHHVRLDRQPLAARMPRFDLHPREVAALVAYLERLGDAEPLEAGVSDRTLRFATVPPASAELAIALEAAIRARFERENRNGGSFGRRLELLSWPAGTDEAFALVAPWLDADATPGLAFARGGSPVYGAFGVVGAAQPDAFIIDALPDLARQTRALLDALSSTPRGVRLVVSHALTAAVAPNAQSKIDELPDREDALRDWVVGAERGNAVIVALPAQWSALLADAGARPALAALGRIGVPHVTLAGLRAPFSEAIRTRLTIAYPGALPDREAIEGLRRDLQFIGAALTHPGLQFAAYASTDTAIAALHTLGREVNRERFARALTQASSARGQRTVTLARIAGDGRSLEALAPLDIPDTIGESP